MRVNILFFIPVDNAADIELLGVLHLAKSYKFLFDISSYISLTCIGYFAVFNTETIPCFRDPFGNCLLRRFNFVLITFPPPFDMIYIINPRSVAYLAYFPFLYPRDKVA